MMHRATMAWVVSCAVLVALALLAGAQLWQQGVAARSAAIAQERDTRLRLALWRMDAWLVPRLTAEQSRVGQLVDDNPSNRLPTELFYNGSFEQAPSSVAGWLTTNVGALPDPVIPDVSQTETNESRDFDLSSRDFYAKEAYAAQQTTANLSQANPGSAPPFTSAWIDDQLKLLRYDPLSDNAIEVLSIDYSELSQSLTGLVNDLLPEARLIASHPGHPGRLASLPLALEPGQTLPGFEPPALPVARVVTITASLLLAALALTGLAAGSLRLARRRSAFVAAVTHELRTPLTTLRLYGELLEQDMVPADDRASYLTTLRQEADRLAGLVDNVLAFAGLEGRRHDNQHGDVGPVLAQLEGSLRQRASDALTWTISSDLPAVTYEASALEHILANLVDNAAKYAPGPLTISASAQDGGVVIAVCDQGDGVAAGVVPQLFRAFRRGDPDGPAPGIGLGLALCRDLARRMRGDLRYRDGNPGARFELWLRA